MLGPIGIGGRIYKGARIRAKGDKAQQTKRYKNRREWCGALRNRGEKCGSVRAGARDVGL